MKDLIELTQNEIEMGFVASCIEHVARKKNVDYKTVYEALKKTNGIKGYIYPFYNTLHSQSREYINEDIVSYLHNHGVAL